MTKQKEFERFKVKRIRKNLGNLTKQLLGFGELGEVLVKRRRKFKEISESI
jgi:hypothetical protein